MNDLELAGSGALLAPAGVEVCAGCGSSGDCFSESSMRTFHWHRVAGMFASVGQFSRRIVPQASK